MCSECRAAHRILSTQRRSFAPFQKLLMPSPNRRQEGKSPCDTPLRQTCEGDEGCQPLLADGWGLANTGTVLTPRSTRHYLGPRGLDRGSGLGSSSPDSRGFRLVGAIDFARFSIETTYTHRRLELRQKMDSMTTQLPLPFAPVTNATRFGAGPG